ncbi:DUF3237 domain-containing protein [Oceanobacter mangrovi]|uniref:DUF3237 domain-containing protein n=1 Tax=Oceanobacter mangrovi TaxID=2862510 RepID=UPI001C8EE978|nr:DUF3237 domain-containing protein [Oceanobacter mangrovi]
MQQPQLRFFARLKVTVDGPQEIGQISQGLRRVIPITGGTVEGDGWSGKVLPGGADFQLVMTPRMAALDARYILESTSGERIFIENRAVRVAEPEITAKLVAGEVVDPALIYFRCTPRMESAAERFQWVSERIFVGTGVRHPDSVELTFYEVL